MATATRILTPIPILTRRAMPTRMATITDTDMRTGHHTIIRMSAITRQGTGTLIESGCGR